MSGARHRRKGDRIEREVVDRDKALGIHAERYRFPVPANSAAVGMTWIFIYLAARRRRPSPR